MKKFTTIILIFMTTILLLNDSFPLHVYADNTGEIGYTSICANGDRSLALREDGTLWQWGKISYDKINVTPVQVEGIDNVKKITAYLVLKNDGTVWAFNNKNSFCQQIYYLDDVKDISDNIIIKNDGTVCTYNDNTGIFRPKELDFIKNVKLAKENYFLKNDGTVWMYSEGSKQCEQIEGLSDIIEIDIPDNIYLNNQLPEYKILVSLKSDGTVWKGNTEVKGISDVEHIVIGGSVLGATKSGYPCFSHFYACLKKDGTVWSWGDNYRGQLGNGTFNHTDSITQVKGLSGIKSIDAGYEHVLVLGEDGKIQAWGCNVNGQLGIGHSAIRKYPEKVANIKGAVSVSADNGYISVLKNDGTVLELNKSGFDSSSLIQPIQVSGISNAKYVNSGSAIDKNGFVWVWDGNRKAKKIKNITGAVIISDDFVLCKDGTVWTINSTSLTAYKVPNMKDIISIDVSLRRVGMLEYRHIIALKKDGTVLDIPSFLMNEKENFQCKGYSQAKAVSALSDGPVVLKKDGTVWVGGSNGEAASQVKELKGIISISPGDSGFMALKNDGTVWSYNSKVDGLSDVIGISIGGRRGDSPKEFYVALKKDGSIFVWGNNEDGLIEQLGANKNVPVEVNDGMIVLQVGSSTMTFNGEEYELDPGRDTEPVITDGRTLVPIKSIVERYKGTVAWNEADRTVTITKDSNTIELKIDSFTALVNGEEKVLDVAPCIINSRTMLPLRFVTENLGISIKWDSTYKRIYLT